MSKTNSSEQLVKTTAQTEPARFSLDNLRNHCLELFGITSSTFDGVASGLKGQEFTIEEMRNHVSNWMKKEVK